MSTASASTTVPAVKISVLMPVYNTNEVHLRGAMDSILSQTFRDFEFRIINDASTDPNVEKVVLSYADPRITYSRNAENMGISGVRNKLIEESRGEYLAVMDHDDISLPERFQKEVDYLDAHPDVGVVGGQIIQFDKGRGHSQFPLDDDAIRITLMRSCAVMHPTCMIRKSVLMDENVRYEERYSPAEDHALYCRLIPFTKFHNFDEVFLHYRWHESNTSTVQYQKMLAAINAVCETAHWQYPELYKKFLRSTRRVTRTKLFGFLPVMKTLFTGNASRSFLFNHIPFLKAIEAKTESIYYLFNVIPAFKVNKKTSATRMDLTYYLFNIIPIFKVGKKASAMRTNLTYYLFNAIPIFRIGKKGYETRTDLKCYLFNIIPIFKSTARRAYTDVWRPEQPFDGQLETK